MFGHLAIYISNKENKIQLIRNITDAKLFPEFKGLKAAVFSEVTLNKLINEEIQHGHFNIKTKANNSLKNASEGERKRALLKHILSTESSDYIILDNMFDCLDIEAQTQIVSTLKELKHTTGIVQITTRKADILPFIKSIYQYQGGHLEALTDLKHKEDAPSFFVNELPGSYVESNKTYSALIKLNNVCVSYGERPIIKNINWEVKPNEFWQLSGPNGSGKSTILSLITGDNPKGYLQDMILFGMRKGHGEAVWDIKKQIGYFSSEMLRGFRRRDSISQMIISGFLDSVGLYKVPTERQINIANKWLELLNMVEIKDKSFQSLSNGHKRLVLIARAMVKHPPLLILDEPTNGLDDQDTKLFCELVNKIAKESKTAIIYVSHRQEKFIAPDFIYQLTPSEKGSKGTAIKLSSI